MPRCSITPNAATCPSLLLLTCDAYLHAWPPRSAIAGPAFALRHPLALLPLPRAAAALLRDRTGRRLTRPTACQAVGAAACPAPHRGTNGRALRCADLSAKTRFTRTEAEHKLLLALSSGAPCGDLDARRRAARQRGRARMQVSGYLPYKYISEIPSLDPGGASARRQAVAAAPPAAPPLPRFSQS